LALIVANIFAAFAVFFNPMALESLSFRASEPSVWAAVKSLFIHVNTLHLLGNMIFLAAVGPSVEFAVGKFKMLLTYLVAGSIGVLFHWLLASKIGGHDAVVGASGCVAGLVGFAAVRFLTVRVPILPKLSTTVGTISLVWVGLQALGAMIQIGEANVSTAYWAHIGGFLGGVLLAILLKAPAAASLQFGHEVLDKMNERGPTASLAAAELHLKRHAGDRRALSEKAEALRMLGDTEHERETLLQLVGTGSEDETLLDLKRLVEINGLSLLSVRQRVEYANTFLATSPSLSMALMESVVDCEPADRKPDAMVALASMIRDTDPNKCRAIVAELQIKFPLHAATQLAKARGLDD